RPRPGCAAQHPRRGQRSTRLPGVVRSTCSPPEPGTMRTNVADRFPIVSAKCPDVALWRAEGTKSRTETLRPGPSSDAAGVEDGTGVRGQDQGGGGGIVAQVPLRRGTRDE